jgi:hypothetical protein
MALLQLFDWAVDQNAFKKVGSKNRLIKMLSKSESRDIRPEETETKNETHQEFLELRR